MREGPRAPVGASIRARVAPLAQQRADEAFGLAVVGEHALDVDAERCVPRDGAGEETEGRRGRLVGQHFRIREARVIIDGDVHVLPALTARLAAATAVDAMADALDAAELLDVEVHELAGPIALVAREAARAINGWQAALADAPQLAAHRRERQAGVLRDCRQTLIGSEGYM